VTVTVPGATQVSEPEGDEPGTHEAAETEVPEPEPALGVAPGPDAPPVDLEYTVM